MASSHQPTWRLLNRSQNQDPNSPPPGSRNTSTLLIPPGTDIWRASPAIDTFTAPYQFTTIPFSSFRRARVTVSAAWKTQYDQGGLMIVFPRARSADAGAGTSVKTAEQEAEMEKVKGARWIKAGIEFFEGAPQLGVVATDNVSDWSLSPLVGLSDASTSGERGKEATTIEIVAKPDGAWVYVSEGEGEAKKRALREVKWAGLEGKGKEDEVLVGIYGAKPTPDEGAGEEGKELLVEFNGLEIETDQGMLA